MLKNGTNLFKLKKGKKYIFEFRYTKYIYKPYGKEDDEIFITKEPILFNGKQFLTNEWEPGYIKIVKILEEI